MNLVPEYSKKMFTLAKHAIESGFKEQGVAVVESFPDFIAETPFDKQLATFVTLHLQGELRGCIGSLEAHQTLAQDLYKNAYSAAFRDPRFQPLMELELPHIDVEISILTAPEIMPGCLSKEDLLDNLEPFKDGLILSDGFYKATFLPSVWEQLPDKKQFVDYLMRKAGINSWSENMVCQRYHVESVTSAWGDI